MPQERCQKSWEKIFHVTNQKFWGYVKENVNIFGLIPDADAGFLHSTITEVTVFKSS
jgi:hypothetical protein